MKNLTKILCIFFLTIICLTVNAQKNTTFLEKIFKKSKPVSVVESDGRFFVNKIDSIDTGTLRKTAVALPDLTFTTNYSDDPNDRLLFKYCDNDSKPRGLRVLPTDTTYAKYKVTWGDGTSNFEGTYRELIGTLHSYASGKYVLVYSVFFNETWYSQGYTIFAGQAPNVNILNPGRNEICIGDSLKFTLSGANVKGTTYTVIFSDDPTKPLKYNDDNPLPASITHKYLKNSCGSNFTSGKTSFPNAFGVTVLATNSCGTSSANVGPIYVSSEPKPKITLPEKKCIGEIVTITNSTTVATTPDQTSGNCTTAFKKIWIINADTSDYTIIKGDLGGTNFPTDPTDPDFWYSGSNVLEVKFNRSGRYTIRLLMANTCFMKEIPQVIIIEPEIDPTFTAITETNECGNLIVQATNKTVIDNAQFDPKNLPVFSWSVSPSGNYFIGGTNANSANPKFNFTVPGNYTVSLTYTGTSCLPTIATQDFIVQGNPIASINGMSACIQSDDTARVVATALINTYGLEIQNRLWKIIDMNGSVIFTSSDPAPLFKFTSTIAGNYKAQLTIETTCGTTTAIRNFVVALMPVLNAESNRVVCTGQQVSRITFSGNAATTGVVIDGALRKFRWENDNTTIGLASSGYDFIDTFTAINDLTIPQTATITVYPINEGCQGFPVTFTITVNPSKVTIQPASQIICKGSPVLPIQVIYNGVANNKNARYQWFTVNSPIPTLLPLDTLSTIKPSEVESTFYFCRVTPLGGCDVLNSASAKVTVNPTPKIHDYYLKILTGTSFTLQPENGETLNGITNIVPVGTKYSWIIDNINPVGAIQGATVVTLPRDTIIQTLTNNTKGNAVITYKVIPVSSTCNGDTFTVVVSVVPPKATVNPENIKCFGNNDGKITINNIVGIIGSNNPLVTCVRPIDNSSFTPSIITQDSIIFTGLSSGRYVITINDAQSLGIPFKDTVDIFEPERIDLQIISKKNINCYGIYNGEINLTVVPRLIGSNNYTYNWFYSTNSADWTAYTTNIHDPLKLKNLAGGYFYLKITDVNGCSASTPVIRIVEPQPFYFNADVVDAHDCDNVYSGSITNIQFGGGTVLTDNDYKFSFRHNTNFYPNLNITGLKAYLSAMQPGTYEITMTDIFNCTPLVKQFTIKRPDPLEVTINSRINFDCANNKTTQVNNAVVSGGIPLVDNQGKMYYNIQWKAGNEVVGTGETFINIKSGEFINIEVTDKRGCKFSGNVSFISKLPELSWTDTLLNCNTRRYRFTAIVKNDLTQNYTFIWKFGNVDRVTTAPVLDYNFPTEGNYTVQLIIFRKDGLCEFPFSKNILVQSPPNLVIRQVEGGQWNDEKKEVRFCKGESVKVYIDGANSYYWSVDGSTKSFVTITEQGDYFVEGKTISGCATVLNFKALYNIYNYSIITDKDNPLKNNEVQLNFTNTTVTFWTQVIAGSSYTWDFGDGTPTENGFKKPHTYNVSSLNYFDVLLEITNPDGCKEEATKRIWITAENLPNTITPNGDGINDVFMAGWKIQIFNRNGILLYQGTGGWNGTYNGKPVSNGTYFYILIYSSLDSPQTKTGFVTVIR